MHPQRWILIVALSLAGAYLWLGGAFVGVTSRDVGAQAGDTLVAPPNAPGVSIATFASGCFWCT